MNSFPSIEQDLAAQIRRAYENAIPLQIVGGASKCSINLSEHEKLINNCTRILDYSPEELVLTIGSATPLTDINKLLAERRQMLAFEPPGFGEDATIGGTLACSLSGPRRPFAGAIRDSVLGLHLINGRGETLKFGGQVIKNVAGYDVSKLMAGTYGTLGLVTQISLKVLPLPEAEITLAKTSTPAEALKVFVELRKQPLPLSGLAYFENTLYIRLSGTEKGVSAAKNNINHDEIVENSFWSLLKEHQLSFFQLKKNQKLCKLSLPPATPPISDADQLIDWGGALRWWKIATDFDVQEQIQNHQGHVGEFGFGSQIAAHFEKLPKALLALHKNLKLAFDPKNILNPHFLKAT